MTRLCEVCGKEMEIKKRGLGVYKKYCSQACKFRGWRQGQAVEGGVWSGARCELHGRLRCPMFVCRVARMEG